MLSIPTALLAFIVWFTGLGMIFTKVYGFGIFIMLVGLLILRFAFSVSKYEDSHCRTINQTINDNDRNAQSTTNVRENENQPIIQVKLDNEHSKLTIHYDSETNTSRITSE